MPPKKPVEKTHVEINGQPLECLVCGHALFFERRGDVQDVLGMMNRRDFYESKAACRICAECGYIHWFELPK
ncbi:MAG TPA: hypothetical protein QGH10_19665 [Armatimonadota bacterium]|nr:hypothetical protein [Armatimonadota bacterium]